MSRRPLLLLALLAFGAMTAFGLTLPTLAYLAQDLGASDVQVGFLPACYFGMQFFFAPTWGALSDRVGRRPLLLLGMLGFAMSFAISGFFATALPILFTAMLIAGILGSATLPAVRAAVADVTTHANRARGMGMVGACIGLGFVFGPGTAFGLMHGLAGDGIPDAAATLALHRIPFRAAMVVALVTAAATLPFLRLPAPIAAEVRVSGVRALLGALRGPLTPVYLTALLATFALAALEASLPLFVKSQFRHEALVPASYLAKAFVTMGITGVIVQGGIVSRLIGGMGERRTALAGLVLAAIGFGSVPLFSSPDLLLAPLVLLATGMGLIRPSIATLVSRRSASAGQGGAIGSLDSFESLGRATGNPTGGALHALTPFAPFMMASAVAFCAIIPLLALGVAPASSPADLPERP